MHKAGGRPVATEFLAGGAYWDMDKGAQVARVQAAINAHATAVLATNAAAADNDAPLALPHDVSRWSTAEDLQLQNMVRMEGPGNWR